MELTLIPAYGRDYSTAEAVLIDWHSGRDFQIATIFSKDCGRYTSIRDLSKFPGKHVRIRYNKLTKYILIKVE